MVYKHVVESKIKKEKNRIITIDNEFNFYDLSTKYKNM